jgi:hypothetical protein
MTLAQIIARGNGRAHAWRVERMDGGTVATLWHYSTPMLTWAIDQPDDPAVLDYGTGWGSVSDQNGMNISFRVLGLALRFDRDARGGGPRITELTRHACGHVTDPAVLTCCEPASLKAAA